jgi:uncharacterized membrane protein YfcA
MFWLTAALAVVLVGMAKSGFGGGVGTVATPLMALTISVTDAAAILLPLLIIMDLFSLRHYWRTYDRRSIKLMAPGAVAGVLLGAFVFGYFSDNERILKVSLGILSLAFVAYQLARSVLVGSLAKTKPKGYAGVGLGAAAGFTSTLAHAGGPPATIYLLPQQFPRAIFVGTNVVFFALVNQFKLVPYAYLGLLRIGNLATILLLMPLAYVGVRLGIYLNKRFNDLWFNRVVYALLLVTGIELITERSLISILL